MRKECRWTQLMDEWACATYKGTSLCHHNVPQQLHHKNLPLSQDSLHMDLPCCPPRAFPKKHLVAIRNPISITLPRNEQSAREFLSKSRAWFLKITVKKKKTSVAPGVPCASGCWCAFLQQKCGLFFWGFIYYIYQKQTQTYVLESCVKMSCFNSLILNETPFQVSQLVGEVWWFGQISRNSLKE